MSRLLIVAVVLASFVAVSLAKCDCTPDQWEGTVGGISLGRRSSIGQVNISYDATDSRVAMSEWKATEGRKKPIAFKAIADFKKKKAYIFWNEGKDCKVKNLTKDFHKMCINVKGITCSPKSDYLGAGSDKLKFFNCEYKNEYKKAKVYANLQFTESCYPIGESVFMESRRGKRSSFAQFTNITPGIKDAKIFNPPASCTKKETEILEEYEQRFEESVLMQF